MKLTKAFGPEKIGYLEPKFDNYSLVMKTIVLVRAMHAPLQQRYDLRTGQFELVGDTQGTYSREDSVTGAEYRCLGESAKHGKVRYSSDLHPGAFYPENVFIWGKDYEKDIFLPHEEIEGFCKQLRFVKTKRVLLPNGFKNGKITWDNGIYFSPIEWKPDFARLPEIIKQQMPNADIMGGGQDFCIEVTIN